MELWNTLQTLFQQRSTANKLKLKRELASFTKMEVK